MPSEYSLLDGACKIVTLVGRTAELGRAALANGLTRQRPMLAWRQRRGVRAVQLVGINGHRLRDRGPALEFGVAPLLLVRPDAFADMLKALADDHTAADRRGSADDCRSGCCDGDTTKRACGRRAHGAHAADRGKRSRPSRAGTCGSRRPRRGAQHSGRSSARGGQSTHTHDRVDRAVSDVHSAFSAKSRLDMSPALSARASPAAPNATVIAAPTLTPLATARAVEVAFAPPLARSLMPLSSFLSAWPRVKSISATRIRPRARARALAT